MKSNFIDKALNVKIFGRSQQQQKADKLKTTLHYKKQRKIPITKII